ncbi:MAG: hypothetical protein AAF437_11990 [Pseudomonadota bacterium]
MVALKHERRVLLLTTQSGSYPPTAPISSLRDVMGILARVYEQGNSRIRLSEGGTLPPYGRHRALPEGDDAHAETNALYIADIHIDDEQHVAKILVNRGDPDEADQAFINSLEADVQSADRPDGYAPGHSAHMVIGFDDAHQTPHGHRMVLEKAVGISRTLLFQFFNHLIREACETDGLNYEVKGEDRPYRNMLKHNPYVGKSLAEDLENGYVTSLELIDTRSNFGGLDAVDNVKKISRRVRMTVERTNNEHILAGLMNRLREIGRARDYDEMQVHISTTRDENASPRFNIEMEEAADMIYSRVETVSNFGIELESAYSELCDELTGKLTERLTDADTWRR